MSINSPAKRTPPLTLLFLPALASKTNYASSGAHRTTSYAATRRWVSQGPIDAETAELKLTYTQYRRRLSEFRLLLWFQRRLVLFFLLAYSGIYISRTEYEEKEDAAADCSHFCAGEE